MLYEVHLSQKADKFLEKLELHISKRIKERLTNLSNDPVPKDSKFITRDGNDKIFRYRIGDFRALYIINEKEKIVLITKIDKRPRIYQ